MARRWNATALLLAGLLGISCFAMLSVLSGLPAEAAATEPPASVAGVSLPEHAPTLPISSYQTIASSEVLTYSISGQVYDRWGGPLANVMLTATGRFLAYSDAHGVYRFSDLPEGNYVLLPSKIGYTFAPESHSVSVPPDANGHNFSGTIPLISGRVTDGYGNPFPGVAVGIGSGQNAVTDASGLYTITEVIAGDYTLTPFKVGYVFAPASTLVSVPPDASGHNFTGTLPAISGQVVNLQGAPVAGVDVSIDGGQSAVTGEDGRYAITDVYSGTYVLTPQKIGYAFAPTSTLVSVPPNANNRNFTSTLASRISGRLTYNSTGLPLRHRLIKARRNMDDEQPALLEDFAGFALEYTTRTDDDGNYTFDTVLQGSYILYSGEIGFTFTPASHSVSVPPDAEGHNFTGTFQVHLPFITGER